MGRAFTPRPCPPSAGGGNVNVGPHLSSTPLASPRGWVGRVAQSPTDRVLVGYGVRHAVSCAEARFASIATGTLALGGCGSGDAAISTERSDAQGGAADVGLVDATTDANGPTTEAGSDCASAFAVREGATATVLASNQSYPSAIAVDSTSVYWTNLGPLGGGKTAIQLPGSVMKVPIGGGAPIELAATQVWPGRSILRRRDERLLDHGERPRPSRHCGRRSRRRRRGRKYPGRRDRRHPRFCAAAGWNRRRRK